MIRRRFIGVILSFMLVATMFAGIFMNVSAEGGGGSDEGLVAYWSFDNDEGNTIIDDSGNDLNGTNYGATSTDGIINKALKFDGENNYVGNIGTYSSFNFMQNTGIFTVDAWIKLNDYTAEGGFVIAGATTGSAYRGFFFGYQNGAESTDNQLRLFLAKGSSGNPVISSLSSVDIITDNEWHYVVATGDGSNVVFYIDGVSDSGSGTMGSKASGDSSDLLNLGRSPHPTSPCYFNGLIDEVHISNVTRSAQEISDYYTKSVTAGYWKFDEGSGTTAYDSSGNNNDGSLNGDPQWVNGINGGALQFDGDYDWVEVGQSPSLQPTKEITFSAWVNLNYNWESVFIISGYYGDGVGGFMLSPHMDMKDFYGAIYTDTGAYMTNYDSYKPLAQNVWYSVACTYDGSKLALYINGTKVNETPASGDLIYSSNPFRIGTKSNSQRIYDVNGIIDEVRISNYAKSAQEIWDYYYSTKGIGLDLFIESSDISFSNPKPTVGETIMINATLHNIGINSSEPELWETMAPMPTARYGLASVSVNGKIYAIGGSNNDAGPYFSTVEEYDPVNDSWTTKASMPTARHYLAAGAVDGKIYVVGGHDGSSTVSAVWEYNPINNTWSTKADIPTPRYRLAAAAVNGKIYAIGGRQGPGSQLSTVEEYDPSSNTWSTKASMLTAKKDLAAVSLNGKLYSVGGYVTGSHLKTFEEYDPDTDNWVSKPDIPTPHGCLASVGLNDKIYAIGGHDGNSYLSKVDEYDPDTNIWSTKTSMPTARYYLAATTLDAKIYAIGGLNGTCLLKNEVYTPKITATATVSFYDGNPDEGGVLIGQDNIVHWGNTTSHASIEWTPKTTGMHNIFIKISSVVPKDSDLSNNIASKTLEVTYLPPIADAGENQTVNEGDEVLLDGSCSEGSKGYFNDKEVDSNVVALWHMDEGSGNIVHDSTENDNDGILTPFNEWTKMDLTVKPSARQYHSMAPIYNEDQIVLYGGENSNYLNDTWVYDSSENSWINKNTTINPSVEMGHVMASISYDDKAILFGGYDSSISSYSDKTWVYDLSNNTWTEKSPSTKPPARIYHTMASIANDDKVLLFAGKSGPGSKYSDTWVYDLSDNIWSNKNPSTHPPAMYGGAMAGVYNEDKIVLFGGYLGSGDYDDKTWVYDLSDNTWSNQNPSTKPTARGNLPMAALTTDDKFIIFGGSLEGGGYSDETWIYDLSENVWSEKNPTTKPSSRYLHQIAVVYYKNEVMLFGGRDTTYNNETWKFEFNGAEWVKGIKGNALLFDGVDDCVIIADDDSLDFGTGSFTVEFWMKHPDLAVSEDANDEDIAITKMLMTGSHEGFRVTLNPYSSNNGQIYFAILDIGANEGFYSNVAVDDNKWHYIVCEKISNEAIKIFVDGALTNSASITSTKGSLNNNENLYIGGHIRHWKGSLDEIRISNIVRTAQEISDYYNKFKMAAYWDFNEGIGQVAKDISGNENDGQLGSTTGPDITDPQWVEGVFDSALEFKYSEEDDVKLDSSPIDNKDADFTLEAWIKPYSLPPEGYIYSERSTTLANPILNFLVYSNGTLCFYLRNNNGMKIPVYSETTINLNEWQYVVAVRDFTNEKMDLYINGELDSSVSAGSFGAITLNDFTIGRESGPDGSPYYPQSFDGVIDELIIWDSALSDQTIQDRYNVYFTQEIVSYEWDFESDGVYDYQETLDSAPDGDFDGKTTHTYYDNGEYTVTLKVIDEIELFDTDTCVIIVNNVAPTITSMEGPIAPIKINDFANMTADFIDPGTEDTHTATWDWGDDNETNGTIYNYTVKGAHKYTVPGVYKINLSVKDDDGGSDWAIFEYIVIYNPEGGFVTGGGWIMSPTGAYKADPNATGKANFGFVSKYKNGGSDPTGNTEFQFKAGNLNLHSSDYDWLVIAGCKAKYKGTGTINGEGNYGFMISAIDGSLPGGGGVDKFRIKIWDKNDNDKIIYDNMMDSSEDSDPTTALGGGNIIIHKS